MAPPSTEWMIIPLYSDVCMTKGVPVPYAIVSEWEAAEIYSGNVAYNGCLAMTVRSITRECKGDEAGDAGVVGGTVGGVCHMDEKSESVRINGSNAVRDGDEVWMNNRNTKGKVLIIPAVSKSSDPASLGDLKFNAAVAQLVEKMEAEGKGAKELKDLRNPQPDDGTQDLRVVNNPVIVAAEYYFLAKGMAGGGSLSGVLIDYWFDAKKCGPNLPYTLATSKLSPFRLKMNKNQPPSEWDDRFAQWAARGWEAGGGTNSKAIAAVECAPPTPTNQLPPGYMRHPLFPNLILGPGGKPPNIA